MYDAPRELLEEDTNEAYQQGYEKGYKNGLLFATTKYLSPISYLSDFKYICDRAAETLLNLKEKESK